MRTSLGRITHWDDTPLWFLNKISFMRETWVSDKAIPLLTIAKHPPYFFTCLLWKSLTVQRKYLRTMQAFVSSIDLQFAFDPTDRNHDRPSYVISAQNSGYEAPFKVRSTMPLCASEQVGMDSPEPRKTLVS